MINDNYCRYDKNVHRYILTTDFALEKMNIDLYDTLNTSGNVSDVAKAPEIFLDRVSALIYVFILSNSARPFDTERKLALDNAKRQAIMDAIAEQMLYLLNNGDASLYSGVNTVTGGTIDPYRLSGAIISPIAASILQMRGIIERSVCLYNVGEDRPTYDEEGY